MNGKCKEKKQKGNRKTNNCRTVTKLCINITEIQRRNENSRRNVWNKRMVEKLPKLMTDIRRKRISSSANTKYLHLVFSYANSRKTKPNRKIFKKPEKNIAYRRSRISIRSYALPKTMQAGRKQNEIPHQARIMYPVKWFFKSKENRFSQTKTKGICWQ